MKKLLRCRGDVVFYKGGETLGSAKSRVFYSAMEMLVSRPKPLLSNKDEYWVGAHRVLLGSILGVDEDDVEDEGGEEDAVGEGGWPGY